MLLLPLSVGVDDQPTTFKFIFVHNVTGQWKDGRGLETRENVVGWIVDLNENEESDRPVVNKGYADCVCLEESVCV